MAEWPARSGKRRHTWTPTSLRSDPSQISTHKASCKIPRQSCMRWLAASPQTRTTREAPRDSTPFSSDHQHHRCSLLGSACNSKNTIHSKWKALVGWKLTTTHQTLGKKVIKPIFFTFNYYQLFSKPTARLAAGFHSFRQEDQFAVIWKIFHAFHKLRLLTMIY